VAGPVLGAFVAGQAGGVSRFGLVGAGRQRVGRVQRPWTRPVCRSGQAQHGERWLGRRRGWV